MEGQRGNADDDSNTDELGPKAQLVMKVTLLLQIGFKGVAVLILGVTDTPNGEDDKTLYRSALWLQIAVLFIAGFLGLSYLLREKIENDDNRFSLQAVRVISSVAALFLQGSASLALIFYATMAASTAAWWVLLTAAITAVDWFAVIFPHLVLKNPKDMTKNPKTVKP